MITDTQELNDAIIENLKNEEVLKIMAKASRRYYYILTESEIESCKLRALWKALRGYDPDHIGASGKKQKFFSYLYRGVMLECTTLARFNGNSRRGYSIKDDMTGKRDDSGKYLEIMDEIDNIVDGDIIIDSYINGYSTREIAEKKGLTPETIRSRKKKAIEKLRFKMN